MYIPWDDRREYRQKLLEHYGALKMEHLRSEQAEALRAGFLADIQAGRKDLVRWAEPGCLVYSAFHRANVPVISASYQLGYDGRGWILNVPGYASETLNFGPARADMPTHRYQQESSHCWRQVETLAPLARLTAAT